MTFKLVKRPPPADQQYFITRLEVVRKIGAVLAEAASRRDRVVQSWGHTYEFGFDTKFSPGHILGRVWVEGPTAEKAGVTVWHLLSKGTRVRYAQLSDDWQSKTSFGRFSSKSGRGRVTGIDTSKPQEGIRKRNWDEIENEATDERMDKAIRDGYRAGGRKI